VIYDFNVPDDTKLPVNISMSIPKDANLIAVATITKDGRYINADFVGPTVDTEHQVITITITQLETYHLEYYEPISKSGERRDFTYLWAGDYPVDDLAVSILVPVDTNNIITDPLMKSAQSSDGSDILIKDFGNWGAGQQFILQLNYTKTSDKLIVSQPSVQPSQPLNSNTPGRLVLANYLPFVFGGLGLALIVGGGVFFWQSSRGGKSPRRKRGHSRGENGQESDVYCSQCGARARTGDHFCRVCGTKLRLPE